MMRLRLQAHGLIAMRPARESPLSRNCPALDLGAGGLLAKDVQGSGGLGSDFGVLEERGNLPQDHRITRRTAQRLLSQSNKVGRVE